VLYSLSTSTCNRPPTPACAQKGHADVPAQVLRQAHFSYSARCHSVNSEPTDVSVSDSDALFLGMRDIGPRCALWLLGGPARLRWPCTYSYHYSLMVFLVRGCLLIAAKRCETTKQPTSGSSKSCEHSRCHFVVSKYCGNGEKWGFRLPSSRSALRARASILKRL